MERRPSLHTKEERFVRNVRLSLTLAILALPLGILAINRNITATPPAERSALPLPTTQSFSPSIDLEMARKKYVEGFTNIPTPSPSPTPPR